MVIGPVTAPIPAPEGSAPLSIGGLSRATGIPVETLRTWERRYGYPTSFRTPSGHRRYTLATAERLRLVQAALQLGHRPSAALAASEAQLREILRTTEAQRVGLRDVSLRPDDSEPLRSWMRLAVEMRGADLGAELRLAWQRHGARAFVIDLAVPLMWSVGDRWRHGRLSIAQEHLVTERLRDFLAEQWRPLSDHATGPRVIGAALPHERHTLVLHMGAVLLALESVQVDLLGAETPEEDIADAARSWGAAAVLVGVSRAADAPRTRRQLATLRALLPPPVRLVAGGATFELPPGVDRVTRLDQLSAWAKDLELPASD